jgi:hypothetical protein
MRLLWPRRIRKAMTILKLTAPVARDKVLDLKFHQRFANEIEEEFTKVLTLQIASF